ncbi:hypothetical protein [Lentzea sp. NPDC092896]|uniref:hypothetical protein n=1 Tax=Lentzea sp. NPDC092896 TaxID=3364127 RepID=UPI00380FC5AF
MGTRLRTRWAWKPPLFTVAGCSWYFPTLITVWHREPRGHETGAVCKRTRRKKLTNGRERHVVRWAWLLHVHHWHLQIHPWQKFRRWALTRCEWCGGRSRGRDQVDVNHGNYRENTPWWRGEEGLYHSGCSAVESAHGLCLCTDPLFEHATYGKCFTCGKSRCFGMEVDDGHRALATLPVGSRITPEMQAFLEPIYAERRVRIAEEAKRPW